MAQSVSFQFQYGTIKTYLIFSCFLLAVSDFNSIMVQLKPFHQLSYYTRLSDFNSIMVQLKRKILMICRDCLIQFQFHNGTIKTNGGTTEISPNSIFQFHNGTIKTLLIITVSLIY